MYLLCNTYTAFYLYHLRFSKVKSKLTFTQFVLLDVFIGRIFKRQHFEYFEYIYNERFDFVKIKFYVTSGTSVCNNTNLATGLLVNILSIKHKIKIGGNREG